MKYSNKMELVLVSIICVLCALLLFNLFCKLRSVLPWRVNCWFCNINSWTKFVERNCWTCSLCDQYNGFTKDGDYNKPICQSNEMMLKTPKPMGRSPPRNGLCKMCNINQQLKVAQLANFVPMNEKKFDVEIEAYRHQLEKAYKLCTPCKKVIQVKLHKEKEYLLGSKLLESRTPEKKTNSKRDRHNEILTSLIRKLTKLTAILLLILVTFECYKVILTCKNFINSINNFSEILSSLIERIYAIIKMKTKLTFPAIESNIIEISDQINFTLDFIPQHIQEYFSKFSLDQVNSLAQEILGGFGCLLQIIGHLVNKSKLRYSFTIDLLMTLFLTMCMAQHYEDKNSPLIMSVLKFTCVAVVLLSNTNPSSKSLNSSIYLSPPKRLKNLARRSGSPTVDEEHSSMDTDDDVSLTKFGLHNYTDSSNETIGSLNKSVLSGRTFSPRLQDSIWSKPKLNSTFCASSVISQSPSSITDTVFVKPSFNKYRKLAKDDSDSDLDESISSLCIGSPKKANNSTKSVFALRQFTATPSFVTPTVASMSHSRPVISPSKLGHGTSWVAGGYWGSDGDRLLFNMEGSRSSSQSSGFESQTSSMNQRNPLSQPSSREESVCGDPDRGSVLSDRFQHCSMSNYGVHRPTPQSFTAHVNPVYPQMQYNGHVHIPQARFPPHVYNQSQQSHYDVQTRLFKAPGGSGLIKLPLINSFSSRD